MPSYAWSQYLPRCCRGGKTASEVCEVRYPLRDLSSTSDAAHVLRVSIPHLLDLRRIHFEPNYGSLLQKPIACMRSSGSAKPDRW